MFNLLLKVQSKRGWQVNSILAAAGRYATARVARPLFATIAFAGAMHLAVATAEAVTLTPEQQAIVEKYKISRADQETLFGTRTVAAKASPQERAPSEPPVSQAPGFLSGTYVWVGADTYKSIGERLTNINGGTGSLTGSFGGVTGGDRAATVGKERIDTSALSQAAGQQAIGRKGAIAGLLHPV